MKSKEWLRQWRKLYRQSEWGFGPAVLLAAVCISLATALRLALSAIGATLPFATYFPAVLLCALIGGRASGLLSILFSLVAAWWAVYDPHFAFAPLNRVTLANFVLFVVSATVIVFLALMHRHRLRAAGPRKRSSFVGRRGPTSERQPSHRCVRSRSPVVS